MKERWGGGGGEEDKWLLGGKGGRGRICRKLIIEKKGVGEDGKKRGWMRERMDEREDGCVRMDEKGWMREDG